MPSGWMRFTILRHDHPFVHWDLLIDNGDTLSTWRLLETPSSNCWIPADSLPDHRRIYLDYEGLVSGDRGFVSQTLTGLFRDPGCCLQDDSGRCELEISECDLGRRAIRRCDPDGSLYWRFE